MAAVANGLLSLGGVAKILGGDYLEPVVVQVRVSGRSMGKANIAPMRSRSFSPALTDHGPGEGLQQQVQGDRHRWAAGLLGSARLPAVR